MPYSKFDSEKMILRDWLARDRTILANERTFLAYIRTALMVLVTGATLIKLFSPHAIILFCGYGLTLAGILIGLTGFIRFIIMKRNLNRIN